MSTFGDISDLSRVARVRAIDDDIVRLYLEYRNGMFATVDGLDPSVIGPAGFAVGRRVLVREEDDHLELVPDELWPEELWVGVVRIKLEDTTVVDSSGSWRLLPTHPEVEYNVGNTVEVRDGEGVVRVLSKKPISWLDPPDVDDDIISRFSPREGKGRETFEDFGGLKGVVARARELIEVPLKRKEELAAIRARPIKGVLFTGPPGTGKTMLARIIANSADTRFYEISGPQVFSKWYGESEEILRRIFQHAASQERAIVFFDEIDSVASQWAEESHEASRRAVAQLLTSMDGFNADDKVPGAHRDVGHAEVEEQLSGFNLLAPVEQRLQPLQMLFEGRLDGMGNQMIHRERLGKVGTSGLPHAGLVVEVHLLRRDLDGISLSDRKVDAVPVGDERRLRDREFGLQQTLVDGAELAHREGAKVYGADDAVGALVHYQCGERGPELGVGEGKTLDDRAYRIDVWILGKESAVVGWDAPGILPHPDGLEQGLALVPKVGLGGIGGPLDFLGERVVEAKVVSAVDRV
jgi:transitional endoplasmic reticulum ATPase